MNPDVKRKWVKALRSGKYKQTKECLRDNDGYCCLGVLTQLYANEKHIAFEKVKKGYSEENLCPAVREYAGLKKADPCVKKVHLSTWNDNKGADFKKIADLIERNL